MRPIVNATRPSKPLITVKEARKILGADAKLLNDDQVKEMIVLLTDMAEQFLQTSGSKVK